MKSATGLRDGRKAQSRKVAFLISFLDGQAAVKARLNLKPTLANELGCMSNKSACRFPCEPHVVKIFSRHVSSSGDASCVERRFLVLC